MSDPDRAKRLLVAFLLSHRLPEQSMHHWLSEVMSTVTHPKQMETYSTPEQLAEVVYEAATDGKDQLRYVAGADANATYARRLQLGDEAFRKAMRQRFFGA